MTTIYLMRHSIPSDDNLTSEGKDLAKEFFYNDEFCGITRVYTSFFNRTVETGLLFNNNVVIDKRLGERVAGIPNTNISKNLYYYKQIIDENFKFPDGESRLEIQDRMYSSIMDIISNNKDEKVLVVSHGTAMTFLLMKFCNVDMTDIDKKIRRIEFNGSVIYEDRFDYLETFKLVFDKYELVSIESVGNINGIIQHKGKTRVYRRGC